MFTFNTMNEFSIYPATGMPDWEWWRELWPDPQGMLAELGVAEGMNVLDLCCGDGYFTAPLSRLVGARGHVVAVDLDPEMLAAAKSHVAEHGLDNCTWIEADASDLAAHAPEACDFVLIANTFHGAPDKTALARTAADALKPGGRFCIVNWHAAPRQETTVLGEARGPATAMRLSPEATRTLVEPAGLSLDRVAELPPYHYAALFRN